MRLVIQRVTEASVRVDGRIAGEICNGLLVLVGIAVGDTEDDVDWLAAKTSALRIFNDAQGIMNLSVKDTGGGVLAISQFTLNASTKKGNRPSYINAARPENALPLYELYCEKLSNLLGRKVEKGIFGADMKVSLTNDGPVTIIIDSRNRE